MSKLNLKQPIKGNLVGRTVLLPLLLLAMLPAARPAQAAFWCHDYTLYCVSKQIAGKGVNNNRTHPKDLIKYLEENGYVKKLIFSCAFTEKSTIEDVTDFWKKTAESIDKQKLLKPGDVIVWNWLPPKTGPGNGHSGFVDADRKISHFIRQDKDTFDPGKPPPPKKGGFAGGGFRKGETFVAFVGRKKRPSRASIVVYRKRSKVNYKWVLTKDSPILNRDEKQLDKSSEGTFRDDLNNWHKRKATVQESLVTIHEQYYRRLDKQFDWTFKFTISGKPPAELKVDDNFKMGIKATAKGTNKPKNDAMNVATMGVKVRGVHFACDKLRASGSWNSRITVGRRRSSDAVNYRITVKDSHPKVITILFHLFQYGDAIRYVYKRVPIKKE
ncbi:MAG: hypothetical protein QGG42_07445 [Phycisphaerae bacterium]|nr:hypothetical protein [Phycisphaerae bacterium]